MGDLHPFVALALELERRGHDCTVVGMDLYRERIESLGLRFASLSPSRSEVESMSGALEKAMDASRGSEWIVRNLAAPFVAANGRELLAACEGADALVNSSLALAAAPVAEKFGIPRVAATLQPLAMFSYRDAAIFPQFGELSRWLRGHATLNRAWHGFGATVSRGWFSSVGALRRDLGLPPSAAHPIYGAAAGAAAHLAMFSRHFAPDPGDWDAAAVQTGFAFFDSPATGPALPEALATFLEAGAPPVVFTLGSAAVQVAGQFYAHAFAAARALGIRAVLLVGEPPAWATPEPDPNICVAGYAAYSALFPRSAFIVCSGGIGTTAQGLRAGKPMLLVPWAHDQPDNAERVARLGVGWVVQRADVSAATLEKALEELLDERDVAARAAAIGEAIRAEDGAARAADAVERVLK